MLERSPSFSRARTLLQRAGNGNGTSSSAQAATGEAGVISGLSEPTTLPEQQAKRDPHQGPSHGPKQGANREGPSQNWIDELIGRWTKRDDLEVVTVHRQPARSGSFGDWPDRLDPRLVAALAKRDLVRPFSHQAEALHHWFQGRDLVIATSTASGKSLCFQVPILQAVSSDSSARALMLFPTKALGRDQVESMRSLAAGIEGLSFGAGVYDGDAPPDARRAARSRAHAVVTNPDMLHRGILPHHEQWSRFLAGLQVIVIDELHTYRGVFGSHVANVLRRLWRLCRHYGSSPRVVACSATIANPLELAASLCGSDRRFALVDRDASPKGERVFVVLNPTVVDEVTGVRRDYLKVTRAVASSLRSVGAQSLVFCRTRKAVELITRYLRDDERQARQGRGDSERGLEDTIRGYRGGYLPDRRREVERALRAGEARLVASTNALELGIDVGGMDAVVVSGYPGTRAATHQRVGRAGRRGAPSLGVLITASNPLDQFVAADPSFLVGQPPEHARADADNPDVLLPHLRCAAYELPIRTGEHEPADTFGGLGSEDLQAGLSYLAEHGGLVAHERDAARVYRVVGLDAPAHSVDLRGSIEENFSVIDDASGDVLAEVDFEDAPLYVHPGAIYAIEGATHEVRRLDWNERKAYVRRASVDYYTEAISKLRVRVVDPDSIDMTQSGSALGEEPEGRSEGGTGYAQIVRKVPGFKKIRFGTHENIGFGPIELPDLELQTTAAFWAVPRSFGEQVLDPHERAGAALAAAYATAHVAAMLLMCDAADLGHVVVAGHPSGWGPVLMPNRRPTPDQVLAAESLPHIVLFDRLAGGAGLSTTAFSLGSSLFERALAVVGGCSCHTGCPTCLGPMSDEAWEGRRDSVVDVLEGLRRRWEVL